LVVATVATVVLAQSHATALVWLNVVLNPAFARVRSAAALPIWFHRTAPAPLNVKAPVVALRDSAPDADTANVPEPVGKVSIGVAALAGAVIVYSPLAVLLAKAIVPVDVPGMPRTGAMVYPGAAAPAVELPNTVPPAALLSAKVRAGVVVAVATEVVKRGLSDPALNDVTVPVP
jgi:hypothetical protein